MKHVEAYKKGYYLPPVVDMSWAMADAPKKAPIWCSVDLRDGNQALVIPMSLQEKIRFYKTLVAMGFKEIEVGFPAASETEYDFLRYLVDHDLIPDDVTVQVLTQAREHIIKKTFEALKGVKSAIVHVYNSTSVAQREQVFHKSKEEIKEIAVNGARLLQRLTEALRGRNQNTPWKSATQSSTCGNRSQTGRSSSTCHRRCRCPCPISLPPKWPIFPRTFPTVMPLSFPSIPTMTAALVLPMQKWPCSPVRTA